MATTKTTAKSTVLFTYNVKYYGALGDGTTDDTTAILAAFAACTSGGIVYFPAGTYLTTGTGLTVSNAKTIIKGDGNKASIILAPLSTANGININAADCALEDIGIDGRYASQSNSASQSQQCGVYVGSGAHRLRLTRVQIKNTCSHGVSNIGNGTDMLVEDSLITNLGLAASKVQATPSPTTTTFAVAPGSSRFFSTGMSLRIGSQTGTISSITSVRSAVQVATSTTVFTVNVGDGALFANGNVIHIGSVAATISTVVGDVITLTGALANLPIVGQIVAIDNITLTSAITAPSSGDLVATTGGYQKGVYCQGSGTSRCTIRGSYFEGWSQAIGMWYAVDGYKIDGNRLIGNIAYEDASHTTNRSALEVFPSNNVGGRGVISNNIVDGGTHNCMEIAQGEVGTVIYGNQLSNWASELGLGAVGDAINFGGQAGIPGLNSDNEFFGNVITSNGAFLTVGVQYLSYAYRISIFGNEFKGLCASGSSGIFVQGNANVTIANNSFSSCSAGVQISALTGAGTIIGNSITNMPVGYTAYGVFFNTAADGWTVVGNVIEGDNTGTSGHRGVIALTAGTSGNNHTIIGNRIIALLPIYTATNGNYIAGNTLIKNGNDGSGCIALTSTAARNIVTGNNCTNTPGYTISVAGTGDYNQIFGNICPTSTTALNDASTPADIRNTSSGTHNYIDALSNSTVSKPFGRKIISAQTVNSTQTTIAHGLGYIPNQIDFVMTSTGNIWRSASSDATNIYLTADTNGRTCDIYVR